MRMQLIGKEGSAILCRLLACLVAAGLIIAWPAFGEEQKTIGAQDQAIHDAARMGTAGDVQKILKSTPRERDAANAHGSQPIHFAAYNADPGALKTLIAAGANPNARDIDGLTPLHMAVFARNAENTRRLLEAGADPRAKDKMGRDALAIAHEVMANDAAGVISLWILKGCQPKKPC